MKQENGSRTGTLPERLLEILRYCCLLALHLAVYSHIALESSVGSAMRSLRSISSSSSSSSKATKAVEDAPSDRRSKDKSGSKIPFPRTVAIVLAQGPKEPLLFPQLAAICDWCGSAGVDNLIFYEPHGNLHSCSEQLMEEVLCRSGCQVQDKAPNAADNNNREGRSDGDSGQPKFGIRVAGRGRHQCKIYTAQGSDSYEPFVKAAREMKSPGAAAGNNGLEALDPARAADASRVALQEALVKQGRPTAVMEPQIVMVFGEVLTVAGYPPWALRLSEIHGMGRLKDVTEEKLKASFGRYCRTEHRLGR